MSKRKDIIGLLYHDESKKYLISAILQVFCRYLANVYKIAGIDWLVVQWSD